MAMAATVDATSFVFEPVTAEVSKAKPKTVI